MPNAAKKKQGISFKQRIETAARLTAEQQQAREDAANAAGEARRQRKENRAQVAAEAKPESEKKTTKKQKTTKRSAQEAGVTREKPRGGSKKEDKGSVLDRIPLAGPARVLATIIVVVVLACAILYPVGRTYYQALRHEQRLEAQVAAVAQRNEELKQQNEALATDEGVEAQAREELGWVKEGDKSAVVTNAPDDGQDSQMPDQVDPNDIHAPQTWYYAILDSIFFVSE